MLNQCTFIGRLGKDPELRTTQSGKVICRFSIAVEREYSSNEVDWISITAWDKLAENCGRYLTKGKLCAVVGRLQNRRYEASDGSMRQVSEIVAERVKFLSPKNESSAQSDMAGLFTEEDDEDFPF